MNRSITRSTVSTLITPAGRNLKMRTISFQRRDAENAKCNSIKLRFATTALSDTLNRQSQDPPTNPAKATFAMQTLKATLWTASAGNL